MVHNNEHSAEAVNFHMKERRGKKVWPTESTSLGKGSSSILRVQRPDDASIFIRINLFIRTDNVPLLSADESAE